MAIKNPINLLHTRNISKYIYESTSTFSYFMPMPKPKPKPNPTTATQSTIHEHFFFLHPLQFNIIYYLQSTIHQESRVKSFWKFCHNFKRHFIFIMHRYILDIVDTFEFFIKLFSYKKPYIKNTIYILTSWVV